MTAMFREQGPTRWWVPIVGVDPAEITLEQMHAVVSRWLDDDHWDSTKPYALSQIAETSNGVGLEVGTFTEEVVKRLHEASCRTYMWGRQEGLVNKPVNVQHDSWDELATPTGADRWILSFDSPTTFRRGIRSTPLPAPESILRGLSNLWNKFSGKPEIRLGYPEVAEVWVADISGSSETVSITYRSKDKRGIRGQRTVKMHCFRGDIELRCTEPLIAQQVDSLMRFSDYTGIGSQREKGLGVSRLVGLSSPKSRSVGF